MDTYFVYPDETFRPFSGDIPEVGDYVVLNDLAQFPGGKFIVGARIFEYNTHNINIGVILKPFDKN